MKTFDKIYTAAMFLEDHNVEPLNIRIMEDINGYKIVHLYISPIEFKISYPDVKAWHTFRS